MILGRLKFTRYCWGLCNLVLHVTPNLDSVSVIDNSNVISKTKKEMGIIINNIYRYQDLNIVSPLLYFDCTLFKLV